MPAKSWCSGEPTSAAGARLERHQLPASSTGCWFLGVCALDGGSIGVFQGHVPVGIAEKPRPRGDANRRGVVEWFPGRAEGNSPQSHAGLVWRTIGFTGIAGDARQGAVLPGGLTSLGAWDDMVDGQFRRTWPAAAVLASGMITFEEIAPAEGHRIVARPIVPREGQHFRHTQAKPDGADEKLSVLGSYPGPVGPGIELEVLGIHHVSSVIPEQNQRPRHRGHMNWLPVAVQHQSRSFQNAHSHDVRTPRPIRSVPGSRTSAGKSAKTPLEPS